MQGSTSGTITHDGVTSTSNSMTSDEMRASLGITEAPEAAESEPVESVEPSESSDPAPPVDAAPEPVKGRLDPTKDPAKRIAKATYEREQAKREAQAERAEIQRERESHRAEMAAMRAELEALKPKAVEPKADSEPTLEQFQDQPDPYAAYMRAVAKYDLKQELTTREQQAKDAAERDRQQQYHSQAEQREAHRLAEFTAKMEAAFEADPSLQQLVSSDLDMTRPMWDAVMESDVPEKICAYLSQHPEEHQAMLAMPDARKQFRAIARLDASLDTAASTGHSGVVQPKKTAAHAPISPVGGGHAAPASGPPDPKTCTQEEFDAYWNQQERTQRRR